MTDYGIANGIFHYGQPWAQVVLRIASLKAVLAQASPPHSLVLYLGDRDSVSLLCESATEQAAVIALLRTALESAPPDAAP